MTTIVRALLGLSLALPSVAQPPPDSKATEEVKRQRERASERCRAERGTDCETDAGLAEWMQLERSRSAAETEGSRSIHQSAPKPTPRPAN